jgi:hypothetical protein
MKYFPVYDRIVYEIPNKEKPPTLSHIILAELDCVCRHSKQFSEIIYT